MANFLGGGERGRGKEEAFQETMMLQETQLSLIQILYHRYTEYQQR